MKKLVDTGEDSDYLRRVADTDLDTDDLSLDFANMEIAPPTRARKPAVEIDKTDARLAEQVRSAPFRAEALGLD